MGVRVVVRRQVCPLTPRIRAAVEMVRVCTKLAEVFKRLMALGAARGFR